MSWDTKPILRTQGDPAPQAFDPVADIYKVVQSTNNAMWVALKDETGAFIGVTNGKINIRASELETILSTLATAAKQDTIIAAVDGLETALTNLNGLTATAVNQTTIIGHIDGIEALLTAIRDTTGIKKITDPVTIGTSALPTGAATAANQASVLAAVDGLEGLATTLNTLITAIRDTAGIKKIVDTVNVSDVKDLRGLAANKPAASADLLGKTYWSIDTDPHADAVEVCDGVKWVVI